MTTHSDKLTFWDALIQPTTVKRAAKVSALVGTILVIINQGDIILSGQIPSVWKILLTYCVPYSVSSYSSAASMTAGPSTSSNVSQKGDPYVSTATTQQSPGNELSPDHRGNLDAERPKT